MTFPDSALPLHVELAYGADVTDPDSWDWTDVSGWVLVDGALPESDVYPAVDAYPDEDAYPSVGVWRLDPSNSRLLAQDLRVSRGRQDEMSQVGPATVSVVLDNPDGMFTPGNPQSDVSMSRGTPLRVTVDGDGYLDDTSVSGDVDLSGVTDLWVAVEVAGAGRGTGVVADGGTDYRFAIGGTSGGSFVFRWTGATQASIEVPTLPRHRMSFGVHLDVDNGAGGYTVTFYQAAVWGDWEQVGQVVTTSGTTSVSNPGTGLFQADEGRFYRGEIRSGDMNGSLLVDVDATTAAHGATTIVNPVDDSLWDVTGSVTTRHPRFVGFVDEVRLGWPWGDTSSEDQIAESRVELTASSVLRRLGQGNRPARSALVRALSSSDAYWPLETTARSAVGGRRLSLSRRWDFRTDGPAGSNGSVVLDSDVSASLVIAGFSTFEGGVILSVFIPEMPASSIDVLKIGTFNLDNFTQAFANWIVTPTGIEVGTTTGSIIGATTDYGTFTADVSGRWIVLYGAFTYSAMLGEQVFTGGWSDLDGRDGGSHTTAPNSLYPVRLNPVTINAADRYGLAHLALSRTGGFTPPASYLPAWENPWTGHAGDQASTRIARVTADEGIPTRIDTTPSTSLTSEPVGTPLEIIEEAVDADLGVLYELLDSPGLGYLPHPALYRQTPALQLDAGDDELQVPFEPVSDDQRYRDEITVDNNLDAATAAATPFPFYPDVFDVGVATEDLMDHATFRLAARSDGTRYPIVTVDFAAAPHLIPKWHEVLPGDRITITGLPAQHPLDVDLIVEGWSETISAYGWTVEMNCSPASPWNVGVFDSLEFGRLDSEDSTLDGPLTTTTTSFSVTSAGELWTTDTPFDIEIGGERMTVTNVTGTGPQMFTVTRSVNEIVKPHPAGAQVHVADPFRLALGGPFALNSSIFV